MEFLLKIIKRPYEELALFGGDPRGGDPKGRASRKQKGSRFRVLYMLALPCSRFVSFVATRGLTHVGVEGPNEQGIWSIASRLVGRLDLASLVC